MLSILLITIHANRERSAWDGCYLNMSKCICGHCRKTKSAFRRLVNRGERTGIRIGVKPIPCNKYTFTVCQNDTSSVGNKYYVKLQPRKPVVVDRPNHAFLDGSKNPESCTEDTVQDIFNKNDAKWVADNLYSVALLDLSNAGYFTAKVKTPRTPQGHLYLTEYVDRNVITWCPSSQSKTPPLPHRGQRQTKSLSPESATLLRRAGIICQSMGSMKFVTLSYRKSLCQKQSKKHLDTFIKALTRHAPNSEWFWVAELTKKGLIHYHLASTANWIAVDWLRSTWQRITKDSKLQPDIKQVTNPANYMAKYMAKGSDLLTPQYIVGKRCGFSRKLRDQLKPLGGCRVPATWQEAISLIGALIPEKSEYFLTNTGAIVQNNLG